MEDFELTYTTCSFLRKAKQEWSTNFLQKNFSDNSSCLKFIVLLHLYPSYQFSPQCFDDIAF